MERKTKRPDFVIGRDQEFLQPDGSFGSIKTAQGFISYHEAFRSYFPEHDFGIYIRSSTKDRIL